MAGLDLHCVLIAYLTDPNDPAKYLHRLCGLIVACRRTYAETQLLPFQMNPVVIGHGDISCMARELGKKAFGAITNISIQYYSVVDDFPSNTLQTMQEMQGLKRVVFTGKSMSDDDRTGLITKVRATHGLGELEIVFELYG